MASAAQRYENKVTIVTGGSSGIGLGVVTTFVQHGAKVVFCDLETKAEESQDKAKALTAKGPGECEFFPCDMTQESQIKKLIEFTVERYGQLDCLINNAGSHPPHYPIDEFSTEGFRKLIDLNMIAYFCTSKYALPHLRKTKGNIINNASLVAEIAQVEAVTYISTKGAVLSMTKGLALDEAKHDVRVNSFCPGNVWTPMWEQACKMSEDYEATKQAGLDAQPLGRYGTLEEAGLLCLFLAADATFCTGININLSGGAELGYGNKNRKK